MIRKMKNTIYHRTCAIGGEILPRIGGIQNAMIIQFSEQLYTQ